MSCLTKLFPDAAAYSRASLLTPLSLSEENASSANDSSPFTAVTTANAPLPEKIPSIPDSQPERAPALRFSPRRISYFHWISKKEMLWMITLGLSISVGLLGLYLTKSRSPAHLRNSFVKKWYAKIEDMPIAKIWKKDIKINMIKLFFHTIKKTLTMSSKKFTPVRLSSRYRNLSPYEVIRLACNPAWHHLTKVPGCVHQEMMYIQMSILAIMTCSGFILQFDLR